MSYINMSYINWRFFNVVAIVSLLGVSACTTILPKPKPASVVYRLSVPSNAVIKSAKNAAVINIELPQAPRALSGTDIILSPDGRRLTAAGGASWAEPVPNQLRHVLIDMLSMNRQITGVIPKGGIRASYRLSTEIRRFEAVLDNGEDAAPNALVHVNVTLTDTKSRRLIGVYSANTNMRASAKTVSAIVEAQDKATREAMKDISSWLGGLLGDSG